MRYPDLINIFDDYFDCRLKGKEEKFGSEYLHNKTFFKYCALNEYSKQNILKHQIYASSIEKFNDPFDVFPPYDLLPMSKFVSRAFGAPINLKISSVKNDFKNQVENVLKSIRKETHAICLTGKFDNLLMWAHYGNESKGICVEYDFEECISNYDTIVAPMLYSKNRSVYDPELIVPPRNKSYKNIVRYNKKIYKTFLNKSLEWEYEDEYRIFVTKNISNDFILRNVKIIAIYLGPNISDEDKQWILSLKNNPQFAETKLYQLELDNKFFKLNKKLV